MAADVGGEDIAGGKQIGAAMVIDDALGVPGRARGVVERDRIPFVAGRGALVSLVALRDQRLVVEIPSRSPGPSYSGSS